MIGSILGDVVGSIYERDEYMNKSTTNDRLDRLNTNLFNKNNAYTGNTIQVLSVMDSLINNFDMEHNLRKYGLKYKDYKNNLPLMPRMFNQDFYRLVTFNYAPKSTDSDALVRVLPISYYYDNLSESRKNCIKITRVTNDNSESIKAIDCLSTIAYLFKDGFLTKNEIYKYVNDIYKYNTNYNLSNLQNSNTYSDNITDTLKKSIYIFLISNNFEESMYNALSVGGDTSTICAVVGGLIESYYGLSNSLLNKVNDYLAEDQLNVVEEYYTRVRTLKKI